MKKYLWIFIFLILVTICVFIYFNNKTTNNQSYESNYTANRTISDTNVVEDTIKNKINQTNNKQGKDQSKENKELSEFSTKLPKDTKARYSNIDLACKTLNGTIVKKGGNFSLWNVLGCPNKESGYRKAKTFTSSGKITKSYGGGICQVSTTIYNAVLEVKELDIKERHEHSRDVVYIKDGKDAAVSYKSADLKFKNTLDYDIKIEAEVSNNKIRIKIFKI